MILRLALLGMLAIPNVPALVPALACDEECAAGFYFDDALATCIRLPTS